MLRYLSIAALTACLVATTPPADATELTVITAENIEWGLLNPLRGDASPRAAALWGTSDTAHGSLLKLPASFRGILYNTGTVKAVVVSGNMQLDNNVTVVNLTPSSFFAAGSPADLVISASEETVLYIHATGRYQVHTTE